MGFLNSSFGTLKSLIIGGIVKKTVVAPKKATPKVTQSDVVTVAKDFPVKTPASPKHATVLHVGMPVMVNVNADPYISYRARIVSFSRTKKTVLLRRNRPGMKKYIRRPIESLHLFWF